MEQPAQTSIAIAPGTSPRRRRLVFLAALAALAAGAILLRLAPPGSPAAAIYPECLFHEATGLYCAGCGGTRAAAALVRGEFWQAVAYNPLTVFVLLPVLLAWLGDCAWHAFTGRRLIAWSRLPWWSLLALGLLLAGFTVVRNLPWPIFAGLAPHELGIHG